MLDWAHNMSRKSTDHDDDMTEVDVENGNNGWDNHRSDERNDSSAPEHSSDLPSTSMQVTDESVEIYVVSSLG